MKFFDVEAIELDCERFGAQRLEVVTCKTTGRRQVTSPGDTGIVDGALAEVVARLLGGKCERKIGYPFKVRLPSVRK